MNRLFSDLQSSPLLLGLLASALKSSMLLLAVWAVVLLQRRRSAAVRHMAWTVALACSLALLMLPMITPAWKVLPSVSAQQSPARASISSEISAYKATLTPVTSAASTKPRAARAFRSQPNAKPAAQAFPESFKVTVTTASDKPAQPIWPDIDWRSALIGLWLLGVFSCAGFYLAGEWKLRRLLRKSNHVSEPEWLTALSTISAQLQIKRHVRLFSSAQVEVPLTFGITRPVIVLPAEANEWISVRRDTVIRHELAHIARWDALTQIIAHAACVVYWFNPLVWIAARGARFERELACDDHVLSAGASPSEYAGELLTMVSRFQRREHYAVALAMARRSQFEGRLLALLNPRQERNGVSRAALTVIATAALALAIPLAAMQPQEPQPPTPATPPTQASAPARPSEPATVTRPAEPAPAISVVAGDEQQSPTPAPDAFQPFAAPHAEAATTPRPEGFGSAMPALAPRAPSEGGGVWAMSESTPAPPAQTRPQHEAIMPPPERRTGFECGISGGVEGGVKSGVKGGIAGGVGGGIGGRKSHHSSMSTNDDGNLKSMVVSWSDEDCNVSLNSRGDLKFNDDFTAIQSLSQDGFVEINSRIHGESRRLSVHPSGSGLEYVWWVNGNKQPYDDAARKWVMNFLIELDRHSAWAAKQRFPALMREGGVTRVLDEVSYMGSDYARAVYLMTLVSEVNLKPQELIQTLNRASELSSDYETARVLMAIAGKYPLNDQASRTAFLKAIDDINSDYEHARVLMAFFNKGPIPLDMARTILNSASRLKSDYEHSRVLVEMATRGLVDASTQADFLASVNGIKSDYEHSRSLLAFLQSRKSDDSAVLGVIKAAAQIHSDYEAARVLTTVAGMRTLNGAMRDEYIKSAQQIHGEYERNRTLAAIAYRATSL